MFAALAKTLGQLGDPVLRSVMKRGLVGAVAVYVLTLLALWLVLKATILFAIPWLETLTDWLTGASIFLVALLLFPALVSTVVAVFLEEICAAVEDKHYPGLPDPRPQAITEVLLQTLAFSGVIVAANLLALPVYVFFWWLGPVNLLVFYVLNGYLLSREYFELVASRRLGPGDVKALRRTHLGYLWVAGAVIAFILTIPVVNMFAPIAATAFMLHVFERLRRKG